MLVAATGGTGFIGSHTVRALIEGGHRVRLLVRDPVKMKRVYEPHGIVIDDFVVGDMTDPGPVEELLDGCEGLVHAAAVVDLTAARAHEVRRTNEASVRLVVGRAVERELSRIIYLSSASAIFTPDVGTLTVDSEIALSDNAYGQSKAEAERYVRELQARGAPVWTTYPTAVIGPDDPGFTDPNRAVSFFLRFGALLTSGGYQPIDVRDLARMHVAMLESERSQGRYIAAGPFFAWPDLIARIEQVTGRRLFRWHVPGSVMRGLGHAVDFLGHAFPISLPIPVTREGMLFATRWSVTDGSPAQRELGLEFRSLEETLADTYRWMCAAGHLTPKQIGALADTPST
jgi:dihydroflavonol-4-reductase